MTHWIATSWAQIWPNLAANILWVPLAAAHHLLMRRHIRRTIQHHQKGAAE